MKEGILIPESVFQEHYRRHHDMTPNPTGKAGIGGYMLRGWEIAEFLFSGNIYSPYLGEGSYDSVLFEIPEPRQRGLYQELFQMRRRESPKTVFSVKKWNNGSMKEIMGVSQGEDDTDLYVVRASVGHGGRRITHVSYGYYARPSDIAPLSPPANVVSIDTIRQRRVGADRHAPSRIV